VHELLVGAQVALGEEFESRARNTRERIRNALFFKQCVGEIEEVSDVRSRHLALRHERNQLVSVT